MDFRKINQKSPQLSMKEIAKLKDLFEQKNWPIEGDYDEPVFENFCNWLAGYNPEQCDLLISLTGVLCVNTIHNEMFTLNEEHIIKFSLGACCVILAMSGICFMSSGIFNREKESLSVGGGVCMLFLVCSILGLFGEPIIPSVIRIDAMNYFNYMTIISFFKIVPILEGSTEYITGLCILLLIGLITYNIGIVAFDKKDLPL